jgi:hypothetical protein
VEIGLHIHPWNTPPLAEAAEVSARESFLHNLPREAALAKLETVYSSFEEAGLKATSFRGGRYSTSEWIQRFLYDRGCLADASILPFTTWGDEGAPDFRGRGLLPVRREPRPGSHGLWEIPLTLAYTLKPWKAWRRFYEWGEKFPLRQLKAIGIAERLFVKRIWLNLEHPLGEFSQRLLEYLRPVQLPTICFSMHSSSLIPGLNPYIRNEHDLRNLFSRLEACLSILRTWPEFHPATVTEVAQQLEEQYR